MRVELLNYTKEGDRLIAQSAKLCYSSSNIDDILKDMTKDEIDDFNQHLMNLGHESPLEHISFTFGIEGVSRITETQLVRHRIASYSVQSSRYVSRDNFDVVKPQSISNSDHDEEFDKLVKNIENLYNSMIQNGIKKEDARYILPQGMETKLIVTMNMRAILNFFSLRTCMRAQWEIREMAELMLKECKKVFPELFRRVGPPCLNGPCPEKDMTCGKIKEVRKKYLD